MVNVIRPEDAAVIAALFVAGYSVREVAKKTGRARNTVERYRPGMEVPCRCGKSTRHRGWCSWRFSRSPARQKVMRALHVPRSPWRREMDALRRLLVRDFMRNPCDYDRQAIVLADIRALLAVPEEERNRSTSIPAAPGRPQEEPGPSSPPTLTTRSR